VAERFREQAASTDVMTLIKAIDFVNECDIQFRASKHQRLLVELLLMKLASIPYNNREGEKKKFRLKPFRAGEMKPSVGTAAPERSVSPPPAPPKESASQAAPSPVQNTGSKSPQTILTSGLVTDVPSIRTLKKNPGPQDKSIEQSGVEVSEEPTREYTQQEIEQAWNQFIQRRLTTNMQVQTTFKVAVIELQDKYRLRVAFPSATHHHYFNDHRSQLSDFLKSEFDIVGLRYEVDTQKAEEVVLSTRTDREKFSALGEKYPAIKKLSEKFQLRVD
jgi:DNA polymerase-3 subunit gamma/tau